MPMFMQKINVNRAVKSKEITLPSPIMGLNKRDSLAAMPPMFAVEMDNFIPLDNKVELRPGYSTYYEFADKGNKVWSLIPYRLPSYNHLFATYDGKLYDITSTASVTEMGVSLTNNYCQYVQYKNYLYIMNGLDTPLAFYVDSNGDGHIGTWGFSGTGLNAARIIAGAVSKEFLWFIEKGTLKAWYSDTAGNISGTLNAFDLSQISKAGGELVAIANWTIDGGTGIDDFTAFITSEGEVLVYAGANPNDASNWELKGSYKISKPIGYRCTMPYQGDIVIICQDGYFPMGKALAQANAGDSLVAFSDNIRGLVIERTSMNKDRQGWQPILYTKKGYGIFNVPVSEQFEQHVINVNTGAWCRFTNIRAMCWVNFDDNIYFGSDDGIYQFDNGYSDNGVEIEGTVEQAFNDMGEPYLKRFSLINPRTASSAPYKLAIYTNVDYRKRKVGYATTVGYSNGTKWNTKKWSSAANPTGATWATNQADVVNSQWIMNSSAGVKASVVFKTKTKGIIIDWFDTGLRYESGTGIL